jgi:formate dehydrogenase gamma subunit
VYAREQGAEPSMSFRSDWFRKLLLALGVFVWPAPGQHPAVPLYDKDFNVINPIQGENATAPFSTENTCGTCHDYATITSGYHFQMGWDKISDDFGKGSRRPWELTHGKMGGWYPFTPRQFAKKKNRFPEEIDLTAYDFVGFSRIGPYNAPCGACHPGGGGLEKDREGNRYDQHLKAHPELKETLDGDYYRSAWDRSGVVEADCFLCHLRGYNFEERIAQLEKGNYQWAIVAATGLGIVEGAVKNGETPKVTYNLRFFNADGTVLLPWNGPPPSMNCSYCHRRSDVYKRGFTWSDMHNPEIHYQQGMECVDCHPAELDHQIAKGRSEINRVADELDDTMRDCKECHESGFGGATLPRHKTVRPSHVKRMACQTCHIPKIQRATTMGIESTTGELVFVTKPPGVKQAGDPATWGPDYERREGGKIYPFNSFLMVWWGNLDADGILYPLFLREQAAGWKLFQAAVTDDNKDGNPEVNRDEEIVAGLKAYANTLRGNRRFSRIHPVYVSPAGAFHLDEQGRLARLDYDLTGLAKIDFPISHNVAPARVALGTHECIECHATDAHFFKGPRYISLFGPDGRPVSQPMGVGIGAGSFAFTLSSLHLEILRPLTSFGLMLVVFLITLHYHSYGPKRIPFEPFSHEIQRFSLLERGIHLFRLISFVVLMVTGLIMAFNLVAWQELLFSSPEQVRTVHIIFGIVFLVTTILGTVVWFKDALFADYDKEWVRVIGGYLGYKGVVPAGRFNAGQKMFYWYTTIVGNLMSVTGLLLIFKGLVSLPALVFTSTVHNLLGFVLIAGVVAHAYLGTIANPGTWRVLVDGYVTRKWAEHHHPLWYQAIVEKERAKQAASGEQPPAEAAVAEGERSEHSE